MTAPLLEVKDLFKYFPIGGGLFGRAQAMVRAVDGVSFEIYPGETFGLVGESGCGKTTTGHCVLRLVEPTRGSVWFDGKDVLKTNGRDLKALRAHMQLVFQDPFGSLDPRLPIGDIVGEGLLVRGVDRRHRERRIRETLELVGIPSTHRGRYPHEFSGGQRQRIGLARALVLLPKLVVADEPVSALDVSIQSQVLNLMNTLQRELNLSYLFIAHNLAVVKYVSDRIGVMYLGRIVEVAKSEDIYRDPRHPYTRALLSAIPQPDPDRKRQRIVLAGDVPSPVAPPSGCRFHTRCPIARPSCSHEDPPLREVAPGHVVACPYV